MKYDRMLISLPHVLKQRLERERKRGISSSGLIRHLLEKHFKGKKAA